MEEDNNCFNKRDDKTNCGAFAREQQHRVASAWPTIECLRVACCSNQRDPRRWLAPSNS